MVDVDKAELKKPTIHVEMPVWADAKDFLTKLDKAGGSYCTCISMVVNGSQQHRDGRRNIRQYSQDSGRRMEALQMYMHL